MIGNVVLPEWPIIYCNESFISLFGWTRSDVIGKPVTCAFLHGKATDGQVIETFRLALQQREEHEAELFLYSKSGEEGGLLSPPTVDSASPPEN